MPTQKLKLSSNKLGQLNIKSTESNIEVPPLIQVISARARNAFIEGVQTDTVEKIVMQAVDLKAVEVAKAAGFELEEMPAFTVEITDAALVTQLATQIEKLNGRVLSTANSSIALRWVSRGQSGSWGGFKLILNDFKPVTRKEQ
ncbi:hypothetical protein DOK78_000318 [Enterococcus sp. DIV2402]|uniref:Uncharacterized protein n=1 Tax=Candidatus Enterococcus lowellii TaxID=2230877 RepID=A0ABZ2SJQ1_9ENTE|nr:hypothetical protein [Enterococcus sp. DIV2402]MBO0464805.1 hypothetical protein [Enterococcus sp. DIV2402]